MNLLQTEMVDIAGYSLRHSFIGQPTNPVIVLLHGYPDNLQVWYKLAVKLSESFYVFSFDWPGMGYSERWKGGNSPLGMAKRLDVIIRHFNLHDVTLLAHDMGGQAALVFAAKFPAQVKSVFVMNSLLMWNQKTSWEIELLRKFKLNRFILSKLPRIVFRRATQTFIGKNSMFSKDLKDDLWTAFKSKEVRNYIVSMCAGYEGQLNKLPDLYKKIECPVKLIWGEKGKHFDIGHAHAFKEIYPSTEIIKIANSYHWMALENVEEINEIISGR